MVESINLKNGQKLLVELDKVKDRLPKDIIMELKKDPIGKLIGYKMVDGNSFGLVLKFENGKKIWFFEEELSDTSKE